MAYNIIKYEVVNMDKLYRTLGNIDGQYYILQDNQFNDSEYKLCNIQQVVHWSELKDSILKNQINVIDLQVNEKGRIVKMPINNQFRNFHSLCKQFVITKDRKYSIFEKTLTTLFYGFAYANSLSQKKKDEWCNYIRERYKDYIMSYEIGILESLFKNNILWNYELYLKQDTLCRDKILQLMFKLANVN